ncbi:alcohol dehydrogenase, putative [Phytophthora infestans T30-4]|uniref:Alcohol dehydrogenase, putative n=1 Tax=Phytophthora infestans (strain T30-4) TaxID=403677 RepID=D0NNI9_PHYIT|nr:alcohol dehydrogenase, putative [Phytophthora infestans T30-4]EEY62160.1 alcohol dehydrogenase, putative [Phytophthora infestans T30-4]|eukprot:XP_002899191.1 alcohol dehydrogenase, putative [Phytophthora infestans T30-4]
MPSYKRLEVHTKSTDFRAATRIVEEAEIPKAHANSVVVKNHYVGINATDVNVTNGAYTGPLPPPFGCGLDAVGVVLEVGEGVSNVKVGDAVAYRKLGAFAEYNEVDMAMVVKVPAPTADALPLIVCGSSASIALEQAGHMKSNETVLVTAAAGGTGQFVVQLAKLAGNHVIGTTSSDEKAAHLKSIGCDRVINYNTENVDEVLKKEYPDGVNLVFESVGGDLFRAVANNIAVKGRIIAFGHISGYHGDKHEFSASELVPKLIFKSASVRGFISAHYRDQFHPHMLRLFKLIEEKKLVPGIDPVKFEGLEGVPDAIDYMYARKNMGKVVVKLA